MTCTISSLKRGAGSRTPGVYLEVPHIQLVLHPGPKGWVAMRHDGLEIGDVLVSHTERLQVTQDLCRATEFRRRVMQVSTQIARQKECATDSETLLPLEYNYLVKSRKNCVFSSKWILAEEEVKNSVLVVPTCLPAVVQLSRIIIVTHYNPCYHF